MQPKRCWIILLFVCTFSKSYCSTQSDLKESEVLLKETLKALRSALEFFDRNYKHVNLDAVIGTRMVDGILKVLLHHKDYDLDTIPIDSSSLQDIRDIQALAASVSDKAIPYVKATDPPYYRRLGLLLHEDFWTLDFPSKDFTESDIYHAWLPHDGEAIHEDDSDNCITEIFGTGPNSNAKCHISTHCWKIMTKPGYSGYSLTHQIFYLQIAYQMGCHEEMDRHRLLLDQPPPGELAGRFCAAVYLEAKDIEKKGFSQLRQDLFMEQAALCGMLGYRWFFSPEWLTIILSWQDRDAGCYKGVTLMESQVAFRPIPEVTNRAVRQKREEHVRQNGCPCDNIAAFRSLAEITNRAVRHKREQQRLQNNCPCSKSTALRFRPPTRAARHKREERKLQDGCLCHRTTVAVGALANYVRYIAEFEQLTVEKSQIYV